MRIPSPLETLTAAYKCCVEWVGVLRTHRRSRSSVVQLEKSSRESFWEPFGIFVTLLVGGVQGPHWILYLALPFGVRTIWTAASKIDASIRVAPLLSRLIPLSVSAAMIAALIYWSPELDGPAAIPPITIVSRDPSANAGHVGIIPPADGQSELNSLKNLLRAAIDRLNKRDTAEQSARFRSLVAASSAPVISNQDTLTPPNIDVGVPMPDSLAAVQTPPLLGLAPPPARAKSVDDVISADRERTARSDLEAWLEPERFAHCNCSRILGKVGLSRESLSLVASLETLSYVDPLSPAGGENTNSRFKMIVAAKLEPETNVLQACAPGITAFVANGGEYNNIFLCEQLFLKTASGRTSTLVHELLHTIYPYDSHNDLRAKLGIPLRAANDPYSFDISDYIEHDCKPSIAELRQPLLKRLFKRL